MASSQGFRSFTFDSLPMSLLALLVVFSLSVLVSAYLAFKKNSSKGGKARAVLISANVLLLLGVWGIATEPLVVTNEPFKVVLLTNNFQSALNNKLKLASVWHNRELWQADNQALILLKQNFGLNTPYTDQRHRDKPLAGSQFNQNDLKVIFDISALPVMLQRQLNILSHSVSLSSETSVKSSVGENPGIKKASINKLIVELVVIGDGLSQSQWQYLDNLPHIQFIPQWIPSELSLGVTDIHWDSDIVLGEFLNITGKVNTKSEKVFSIQLLDPAEDMVAQVALRDGETFTLKTQPKMAGRYLYMLALLDDKNNRVTTETIHVNIKKPEHNIKVMALTSSPSFEIRTLKNWLASNDAQLLVYTEISRDRLLKQSINLSSKTAQLIAKTDKNKPTNMQKLTDKIYPELLNEFDLLIVDGRTLTKLDGSHHETLQNAVKNGLGVLILADSTIVEQIASNEQILINKQAGSAYADGQLGERKTNTALADWLNSLELISAQEPKLVDVNWPFYTQSNKKYQQPKLKVIPAQFSQHKIFKADKSQPSHNAILAPQMLSALVYTSGQIPLVQHFTLGQGGVAMSILSNTYEWDLSGQSATYSHYWQSLIAHLARQKTSPIEWLFNRRISFDRTRNSQCLYSDEQLSSFSIQLVDLNQLLNGSGVDFGDRNSSGQMSGMQVINKFESYGKKRKVALEPSGINKNLYCGVFWPLVSGWYSFQLESLETKPTDSENKDLSAHEVFQYFYSHAEWLTWQSAQTMRDTQLYLKASQLKTSEQPNSYYKIVEWIYWLLIIIGLSVLWSERKNRLGR